MLIRLLGEVSAGENTGSLHAPRGRVASTVLAILALARGRLVTTESLIDDLWDDPPDTARNAIQVAVSGLRKQFGHSLVDGSRVGYRLRTDLVRIDWIEVEQYLASARDRLNENDLGAAEMDAASAHMLFAGSELAGADSTSVRASRGLAAELRRTTSLTWAQSLAGLGRQDDAIAVLREEASVSPLDEPVHTLLMSVLREQGRSPEALELFDALRLRLDAELGVLPSAVTVNEFHRLLDSGAEIGVALPAPAISRRPIIALPTSGAPLLGRDSEVLEIVDLMRAGNALVTLLGPGGIGKTRLGIEAARAFAEVEQRSAIFLDQTLSRSDKDTRRLLADLLGSEPESIAGALAGSRMVVVIDNAEHLLDETAALAAEIIELPDVRLLVTSRSALELTHERRFEVDGLSSKGLLSPAVQLLVNRAALTPVEAQTNAIELQRLAERCDGIPLVMELLGAALQWESPAELLLSLEAQLASIHDRSRDRTQRHASVRAAIDWSIDHVGSNARRAIGILATIRGSFSSVTAAALIEGVGVVAAQDALAELVDASLVKRVREPGAITFRILEPIRLVAEVLDQARVESNLAVHAEVYIRSLAAAHEDVPNSTKDFDQLIVVESPNLALAAQTRWRQDPDRAVGEIAQLLYGWYRRDRGADVKRWAGEILDSEAGTLVDRARVGIVLMLSLVGYNAWDSPYLATEFDELNARAQQVGDELDDEWHRRWVGANYLRWLNAHDFDQAESWIARMRVTSPIAAFWVHNSKAIVHRSRGRWWEAIAENELALIELPTAQNGEALQTRSELAFVRTVVGQFELAETKLREILAYAESHGLGFERMTAQLNLAFLTALTRRPRECLAFVLAGMDWSGGNVFGSELALYASMALHASGDDTSAHSLASLVATSFLGEAAGKSRLIEQPYLSPHWERLLAELPELVTDPAGGWQTSAARGIVANALARLPADDRVSSVGAANSPSPLSR